MKHNYFLVLIFLVEDSHLIKISRRIMRLLLKVIWIVEDLAFVFLVWRKRFHDVVMFY